MEYGIGALIGVLIGVLATFAFARWVSRDAGPRF